VVRKSQCNYIYDIAKQAYSGAFAYRIVGKEVSWLQVTMQCFTTAALQWLEGIHGHFMQSIPVASEALKMHHLLDAGTPSWCLG
jgi:hypothetical protein